jgi:hypothetical protein
MHHIRSTSQGGNVQRRADLALTVYQLKVVLRDVKTSVWRRVLVPGDATIRTLHETVQVVMGWAIAIWQGQGY